MAWSEHTIEADAVFEALDGLELELEPDSASHVRVYSVYDQDNVRWIQCGLDVGSLMGTLRAAVTDSPEDVVRMLRTWLIDEEPATGFDFDETVLPPPLVIH